MGSTFREKFFSIIFVWKLPNIGKQISFIYRVWLVSQNNFVDLAERVSCLCKC